MFQLHHTLTDGSEGGRDADYETAHVAAIAILAVFHDGGMQVPAMESMAFINQVYAEPLGTPVKHDATSIIFTIVEV